MQEGEHYEDYTIRPEYSLHWVLDIKSLHLLRQLQVPLLRSHVLRWPPYPLPFRMSGHIGSVLGQQIIAF